ncbi:Kinesin motor domain protein [Spraguea lophii 42_110]|uniref:Kinesin-like protein n=1 Tax=Spraguea lophii (strain 42_110) TaxID=1358809 RepID=S7W7L0_SPRLO|nr:Kinesin motor domain protein [Spraguea lophii 42_110]
MKNLEDFFKEKNISHLLHIFIESGIDEPELLSRVKYTDLQQMNIKTFEERRKVFEIINEINVNKEELNNVNSKEKEYGKASGNGVFSFKKNNFFKNNPFLKEDNQKVVTTKNNYTAFSAKNNLKEKLFSNNSFNGSLSPKDKINTFSVSNDNPKIIFSSSAENSKEQNNSYNNSFTMDEGSVNSSIKFSNNLNSSFNSSRLSFSKRNKVNENTESFIGENSKISVCVRKRPVNGNDIVEIRNNNLTVNEPKVKLDLEKYVEKHSFTFDYVFNGDNNNDFVYNTAVREIVEDTLEGKNGTLIAYGQTGTGKTHTMFENDGMVPRAIKEIGEGKISFFEIYISTVMDLLNFRENVQMREKDGKVILKDLVEKKFNNFEEGMKIVEEGLRLRKTGITGANQKSSRSHAILQIKGNGMLTIVDLAGNERGSDRIVNNSTCSITKAEGSAINKSLLVLKECIRGIDMKSKYLPFRQSKLTQLLKSAFTGESNTLIMATISPDRKNVEHTLNTLRYAYRIKDVKKDKKEKVFDTADEIRALKNKIETTVSRLMIGVEEYNEIENLKKIYKKLIILKKEVEENKFL